MAPPPNTPSPSTANPLILSAVYRAPSPTSSPSSTTSSSGPPTHTFSHPLPSSLSLHRAPQTEAGTGAAGGDTPTVRAAYLSELRSAVVGMQREINVFLTARMEEDLKSAGRKVEDEKEEEEYGEEGGSEE